MSDTTDIPTLSIFCGGGAIVVASYIFLYKKGIFKEVYPVFKENKDIFYWLIISAILTVVSVFAVIIYYSFFQDFDSYYSWQRPLFLASLSSFLFFALMWSITLYIVIKYEKNIRYQQIPLILTAFATIGILCSILNSSTSWWIILAGLVIVFHHFFFDAMLWVELHKEYIEKSSRKDKFMVSIV